MNKACGVVEIDKNKPSKYKVRTFMITYFGNDVVSESFFGIRNPNQVKDFTTLTKGTKNSYLRY